MSHILIVDDDADGAAALAARLRGAGHDADWVASVPAAMTRLRQRHPDLVLLDIGMPDFDGLEMLQAVGDDHRFDDLRIAAYSGSTDPQTRAAALRLGACDFIPKSLDWDSLLTRIQEQLDKDASLA